ncbi:HET domain protein, partial [Cadophora sp. MPI-SDFR-AT-0126]
TPLSRKTSSAETWEFVTYCLLNCLNTHVSCCLDVPDSNALPTRLIDVGHHEAYHLRLVTTSAAGLNTSSARYVTLSHRWAVSNVTKLLTSNLGSYQEEIPLHTLPQTFKEAISVTRKLACRYIWIDSLCIIQDSIEDWQRESSKMMNVYKGGFVNIAATAASWGADALFVDRDELSLSSFVVPVRMDGKRQDYVCFQADLLYEQRIKAPLNRRGWVLQERLLSPRTISFSSQISWECRERNSSETTPVGLPDDFHFPNEGEFFSAFWLAEKLSVKSLSSYTAEQLYGLWESIVSDFSCCILTMDNDKLPAISGVVNEFLLVWNDEYLSGLWKNDLVYGLAWYVEENRQASGEFARRSCNYRAPSWSWASVDGMIKYPLATRCGVAVVKTLEAATVSESGDTTGRITSGWVRAEGKLIPLPKDLPNDIFHGDPGVQTGICLDDYADPVSWDHLFLLPILSRCSPEAEFTGLIITPTESEHGEYRRVGLFNQVGSHALGNIPGLEWDFETHDWVSTEFKTHSQVIITIV